ncbi:DUF4436 family protein [Curtobacterium luteum]|uniref:Uncharacterized protein n=1 Tax=Curtobacterium luteum TaxID=33881 RepID=A0A175S1N5_9MICO|nr:DUF4436 family protein [Curtobacterium luteum]KTR11695.1 hypothetical protein NS184_00395 [Curtobacterium luteum]
MPRHTAPRHTAPRHTAPHRAGPHRAAPHWLSATLLSFPALRSAMPGAPPIGRTLDFVFLFPCPALVAIMFVWTGAHLLWRESRVLRVRTIEDDA